MTRRSLARQLRKLDLDQGSAPLSLDRWQEFLDVVDRNYAGADEGRYLLERSLAISSREMQQAYSRQAAMAACSQSLLFASDESAVSAALDTVLDATGGVCAAVDENVTGEDGGLERTRTAWACRLGTAHSEMDLRSWSDQPDLYQKLGPAKSLTIESHACDESTLSSMAFVPVHGGAKWLATLIVARPSVEPWDRMGLQLLTVAAEMIGAFLDQRASRLSLERLGRSKDELIASVSHELRTPLTVVVGLAAELNDNAESFQPGETRELAHMILRQSEDIANIVEDLLVAARTSIGVLTIADEEIDLKEIVESLVKGQPISTDRSLHTVIEPTLARGDPARVRQILRNLLSNATRYGGHNISIEVKSTTGPVVRVIDDGEGVPKSRRAVIFEPFTSAHMVASLPGSVGIGLTVSRDLAQLMGGSLEYSHHGGRSVFELKLRPVAGSRSAVATP